MILFSDEDLFQREDWRLSNSRDEESAYVETFQGILIDNQNLILGLTPQWLWITAPEERRLDLRLKELNSVLHPARWAQHCSCQWRSSSVRKVLIVMSVELDTPRHATGVKVPHEERAWKDDQNQWNRWCRMSIVWKSGKEISWSP